MFAAWAAVYAYTHLELIAELLGGLGLHLLLVPSLAVVETVILLHPPQLLVGVSIGMERGWQQHGSLVRGYPSRPHRLELPPYVRDFADLVSQPLHFRQCHDKRR